MPAAKPRAYASGSTVSAVKSQEQIEALLRRYGGTKFGLVKDESSFTLAFVIGSTTEGMHPTQVRFTVHLPDLDGGREVRVNQHSTATRQLTPAQRESALSRETDRLWRSLCLGIKSKLIMVDDGIETLEQAMYAHVVNPSTGRTVYEETSEQVRASYRAIGPGRGMFTLSIEEKRN